MSFLKTSRDGTVLTLTMSQPETRNALTGNTAVEEFVQACGAIGRDHGVRCVILDLPRSRGCPQASLYTHTASPMRRKLQFRRDFRGEGTGRQFANTL